jgi:hypothetical protein
MKGISRVVGADGLIGRTQVDYLVKGGESIVATTHNPKAVLENKIFLNLEDSVSYLHPPGRISVACLDAA